MIKLKGTQLLPGQYPIEFKALTPSSKVQIYLKDTLWSSHSYIMTIKLSYFIVVTRKSIVGKLANSWVSFNIKTVSTVWKSA